VINEVDLAGASWHKSTRSDSQGGCVSVADLGTYCAVRDSKNIDQYFVVPMSSWRAFVADVKRGRFFEVEREILASPRLMAADT
jgi:hypothetical protein